MAVSGDKKVQLGYFVVGGVAEAVGEIVVDAEVAATEGDGCSTVGDVVVDIVVGAVVTEAVEDDWCGGCDGGGGIEAATEG